LTDEKDYIQSSRDADGYRSLHLIYKYRNIKNPSYDGLRIELQIRTKLQHIWATAVETMGTLLGQALKYRQGEEAWQDFLLSHRLLLHTWKVPPSSSLCKYVI
jgi:ppGpp synthetase/RelA/SpoT-type nucleotidyltranferase